MTTTPSLRPLTENEARLEWEMNRRTYIGGSEIYELLNQEQYGRGCRRALAYRKLGAETDYQDYPVEDDALYRRGKILEPIAGALYAAETGRSLRRPPFNDYGFPIPRRHRYLSWAAVNTDRLILSRHEAGELDGPGDLEIKTRDQGPWLRVKRSGAFPGDELQVQWSMFVTGHAWGAICTLGVFGGLPLIHYDRKRDEGLHEVFTREGNNFADTVFGAGQLPDPDFPATDRRCKTCEYRMTCRGEWIDQEEARAQKQIRNSSRKLVQIDDPELSTTLSEMDLLKAESKAIDAALDAAKEKVRGRLDGLEAALIKGYGKVLRIDVQAHEVMYTAEAYSYLRSYPSKEH